MFTTDTAELAPYTRTPDLDKTPVPPATWPNGQPVPETALSRYLCGADLTRIVLSADSQPLDVGRTRRRHTHAMWLAACQRWQHQCSTVGCHAPARLLEMHHPIPWSEGGQTSLTNSLPLCGRCHTRVHDGHPLTLRDGRRLGPHGYLDNDSAPVPKSAGRDDGQAAARTRRSRPRSSSLRAPTPCTARQHYGPIVYGIATRL